MIRSPDPSVTLWGHAAPGAMVACLHPRLRLEAAHNEGVGTASAYLLEPGIYKIHGVHGHCYPLPISPSGPMTALFLLDGTTTHLRVEIGGKATVLTQDEAKRLAGISTSPELPSADQGQAKESTTQAQNNGDHHHA